MPVDVQNGERKKGGKRRKKKEKKNARHFSQARKNDYGNCDDRDEAAPFQALDVFTARGEKVDQTFDAYVERRGNSAKRGCSPVRAHVRLFHEGGKARSVTGLLAISCQVYLGQPPY